MPKKRLSHDQLRTIKQKVLDGSMSIATARERLMEDSAKQQNPEARNQERIALERFLKQANEQRIAGFRQAREQAIQQNPKLGKLVQNPDNKNESGTSCYPELQGHRRNTYIVDCVLPYSCCKQSGDSKIRWIPARHRKNW